MSNLVNRDGSITLKVLKAVFGLAEAFRLWFLHLTDLLSKLGKTSINDMGALYRTTPDGLVLILLHVDDMLVMSCKDKYWIELKDYLKASLRGITPQEGPAISFDALHIHQHDDHIIVDRHGYVRKLIEKQTPAANLNLLFLIRSSLTLRTRWRALLYPNMRLRLRYLDDIRPDVKFATSFLNMRMSKPTIALKKLI